MASPDFQALLDGALLAWIAAGEDSPCAESWPAFLGRAVGALSDLIGSLERGEDALVFSSGGTIAAVAASLLGAPPETFVALNRMTVNASVSKIMVGRSGVHLLSFNEHGHVEHDRSVMTFR